MRSAAIQATAIVGARVLPATWTGRMEASATRSPVTPRTMQLGVDDIVGLRAHDAGSDGGQMPEPALSAQRPAAWGLGTVGPGKSSPAPESASGPGAPVR